MMCSNVSYLRAPDMLKQKCLIRIELHENFSVSLISHNIIFRSFTVNFYDEILSKLGTKVILVMYRIFTVHITLAGRVSHERLERFFPKDKNQPEIRFIIKMIFERNIKHLAHRDLKIFRATELENFLNQLFLTAKSKVG